MQEVRWVRGTISTAHMSENFYSLALSYDLWLLRKLYWHLNYHFADCDYILRHCTSRAANPVIALPSISSFRTLFLSSKRSETRAAARSKLMILIWAANCDCSYSKAEVPIFTWSSKPTIIHHYFFRLITSDSGRVGERDLVPEPTSGCGSRSNFQKRTLGKVGGCMVRLDDTIFNL